MKETVEQFLARGGVIERVQPKEYVDLPKGYKFDQEGQKKKGEKTPRKTLSWNYMPSINF